jgi:hypothetical protein
MIGWSIGIACQPINHLTLSNDNSSGMRTCQHLVYPAALPRIPESLSILVRFVADEVISNQFMLCIIYH